MTVQDLINELSLLDRSLPVVLQTDAEGNGYNFLRGADDSAAYELDESRIDRVGLRELTPEDKEHGYTEDDVCSEPCVVLFP